MIRVDLKQMLKLRGMTGKELVKQIGLTEANLSVLRSGKAKAIRFSTLNKICEALNCEPGDILKYEEGDDNDI